MGREKQSIPGSRRHGGRVPAELLNANDRELVSHAATRQPDSEGGSPRSGRRAGGEAPELGTQTERTVMIRYGAGDNISHHKHMFRLCRFGW